MNVTLAFDKSAKTLASGILPGGEEYRVALLSPDHAGGIAEFHAGVINDLDPDQKSFIFPKTRDYFEAHLHRGDGNAMLGVVGDGGRLLAQSMILHPGNDNPETGMVDMPLPAPSWNISVLQAVSVSPDHRGLGLMALMVGCWARHAYEAGRADLLAEIDIKNKASWASFLNQKLSLVGIGTDPVDGTQVYNAHEKTVLVLEKRGREIFNSCARRTACEVENTALQKDLFKQGARCVSFEKGKNILVFEYP